MVLEVGSRTLDKDFENETDEHSESARETFKALDIIRMSAGVILLACILGKVLTGSASWGVQWSREAVSTAPGSYWNSFELPVSFTVEQLAEFSGENSSQEKPILLAIKSRVFDVSVRPSMYGSWGPYRKFTGRDCSRAFSYSMGDLKGLYEPCDSSLDGLTHEQLDRVDAWLTFFERKYPLVGHVSDQICISGKNGTATEKCCDTKSGSLSRT